MSNKDVKVEETKCNNINCSYYGSGNPEECGTTCITCNSWYKNPTERLRRQLQRKEDELKEAKEVIDERIANFPNINMEQLKNMSRPSLELMFAIIHNDNCKLQQQNKRLREVIQRTIGICRQYPNMLHSDYRTIDFISTQALKGE